jgi:hypothetical protein
MALIQNKIRFIFGIPKQEELLAVQDFLMADCLIVSNEDFLKVVRHGRKYTVVKKDNGYAAHLLHEK